MYSVGYLRDRSSFWHRFVLVTCTGKTGRKRIWRRKRASDTSNSVRCTFLWPGSVVGIATGYGLDGPGIESRWGARFSAPVQTGSGAHPASCTTGTGSFPGVKSGRGHPRCCRPATSSVHYTTSCKHSLLLLRMGEIIARNMLS
jgi:hypothetical protein